VLTRSPAVKASLAFVGVAVVCLFFADLEVSTLHPWREMARLAWGAVTPDFLAVERLGQALLQTVAFAVLGVAAGVVLGFGLALAYAVRTVRVFCAVIRAVHELFWALLFLQFLGLTPWTGLLAIAVPYAGIFAKVYSEILEEADPTPLEAVPSGAGLVSTFLFVRAPDVWAHFRTYTLYRLECGLRSSAVLGFVGMPTLGFHLEAAFSQGHYSEASALLILFYVLIATMRLWVRARLVPLYVGAAPFLLEGQFLTVQLDNVARFFTQDIVPAPLRRGDALDPATWNAAGEWVWDLLASQALPGAVATIILTQIALVATGALTLAWFPLVSRKFFGPVGRTLGHVFLVVVRSTPEYILAYILLQLWGPSMLPAIVALAVHNGAIIAHLTGRYADEAPERPDKPRGLDLYAYEVVPRVYGQFLAFLFYRWEVIFRETAILGMLGIYTLGFFVDSAFQDIRFDRAVALILVTALINIGIDASSRFIRSRLRLTAKAEC